MHDSEIPVAGQQVITACAFIHRATQEGIKEVFMARRASTKKFLPNEFELPGGHIEFGENIVEGLKREVKEELGADIIVGFPFAAFTYTNEVKGSQSIEVVYFATFLDETKIKLNKEDHSSCGWFSQKKLPSVSSAIKPMTDDELKTVKIGLGLLEGDGIDFGLKD